jgi:hypothetical protein
MPTTFRYKQIFTAFEQTPRDVCGVGEFVNRLPRVDGLCFPLSDEDLVVKSGVADTKCFRHLGRAGCLSLLHYEPLREALRGLDPARVGIYTSVSLGPIDWPSVAALAQTGFAALGTTLRKHLPPKQIFKYGGNIPAAQLGIFLGVSGQIYSFDDWSAESSAALDQAAMDLELKNVDAAIVVAGFALDDPLQNLFLGQRRARLCEATACALLVNGDPAGTGAELGSTVRENSTKRDLYFGTAEGLVRLWEPR